MKKLNFSTFALVSVSALALAACGGGTSSDTDLPSSAVALPTALKDISFQRCDLLDSTSGTALNGKAITSYFKLNSNGTYAYEVWC